MIYVRPVIERRQIADQPDAADRPPAHVLDQAIVTSAFGAIIMVPPVNLLLLNVRNRQRRSDPQQPRHPLEVEMGAARSWARRNEDRR